MPLEPQAKLDYPLHWAVFSNNIRELESLLEQKNAIEIDKLDVRGRTPLMLAVSLGNEECAKLLLENGANADSHNKQMWSVSNESVALVIPTLIRDVIHYRDYQRATKGSRAMRDTLNKLKTVPDFYCEMKWDFPSWLPFVTKACPSDTYKIYKKGSSVRIDTTLISFENDNWVRGNQSLIFSVNNDNFAEFMVLDHVAKTAATQTLRDDEPFDAFKPTPESIELRMSSAISTTYIDVDQIGFERTKTGLFSWFNGTDTIEKVDGVECKVLAASNVQLVTKKRTEHLSNEDLVQAEAKKTTLTRSMATIVDMFHTGTTDERTTRNLIDEGLTAEQYLDAGYKFEAYADIGKPKEVLKKSNEFKATLWMADEYSLSLQEQIIPIVELMAVNSPHFARLHNFIRLQLPAGFPVKIEIPLFHVMSARIGFQNVNKPGQYVTPTENSVNIDETAFEIPSNYFVMSADDSTFISWEDEDDVTELIRRAQNANARNNGGPSSLEDSMNLQMAIEMSYNSYNTNSSHPEQEQLPERSDPYATREIELLDALRESHIEDLRRQREEKEFEDEMKRVLELSKQDL